MNCSQIFCTFAVETTTIFVKCRPCRCELLSNFLYFCSRNNTDIASTTTYRVVNCSQIFCTFAVETTWHIRKYGTQWLWIALKFFVLLQSKQLCGVFLIDCQVVNCSQIFCTFAVETTFRKPLALEPGLWIALKFFVLLQSKQQEHATIERATGCELLSNFLYFCSRNNWTILLIVQVLVVNCSQIFCTFAVETTSHKFLSFHQGLWIALKFFVLLQSKQHDTTLFNTCQGCELLSNFLYFCSRNNVKDLRNSIFSVVNCSQIFCTFAVETTKFKRIGQLIWLWIALKFFVLLQSKQLPFLTSEDTTCCELLSNFLYFCSRNN